MAASDRLFAKPPPPGSQRPQAVALAYETHAVAPRVLAKGEGLIAEAMLARAKALGVPLKAEPEMVSLLMQLQVDSYVPPALYQAVAEILVWAYTLDGSLQARQQPTADRQTEL
ncbi:MAG: flagellar biosynthesis protein FlhB [Betaproteobacteria bacterium]|nr:flagellar biosynthesis protein FlhB [Betaproteobacteria bacterium]